MRKFVFASAAAALGVALATPALAQEGPQDGPFAGPRVEILGGYDHLGVNGDGNGEGRDGFLYGVGLGYDFQTPNGVVFGIEGEISDSTASARNYNELVAGDRLRLDAGRDLYVGGRIGYAMSPQTLIYGKAGYTNARIEARYDDATTSIRDHADMDGYRLGAGIEYNITPSAYVKGEYRYSHYGNMEDFDIDTDRHQLMAGVGIRF